MAGSRAERTGNGVGTQSEQLAIPPAKKGTFCFVFPLREDGNQHYVMSSHVTSREAILMAMKQPARAKK